MSNQPLDHRMRDCAQAEYRPPFIWQALAQYADEVTSLLIQIEELRQANHELVRRANLETEHVFTF